jgi:hypothetical protein
MTPASMQPLHSLRGNPEDAYFLLVALAFQKGLDGFDDACRMSAVGFESRR